ncbi:MAG: formylglycine-generating enzyme family protein [Phycisphaerales bacterium]|nr:MAG: formylglycine-generating enzyme family protein [Phycisphaerales bacterium]
MTTTTAAAAIALLGAIPVQAAESVPSPANDGMVLVEGGTFQMGDLFDEGVQFATPVHEVTLTDFYLARYEVTVEQFAAFVERTGHITAAEREAAETDKNDGYGGLLATCGCWVLDAEAGGSWVAEATWRNPQFPQTTKDPVTCVSWRDAAAYCNWLSTTVGLAVAYDLNSCDLLDADGKPTTDVSKVKGYRLPTEAEWEYAARERGKKVRFGNGRDLARPDEMNFNAAAGEFDYALKGTCRKGTVPVGSFKPSGLGLYDMSGNVWEWCSDFMGQYPEEPVTNPYQTEGLVGPRRAARGGPWVGGADLARVSARLGWVADDRCNNIGFRVARSK